MRRWLIWGIFVAAWTVALEAPFSATEHLPGGMIHPSNVVVFAKCLHFAVYAFIALSAGWLPLPGRLRPYLVFGVMAHAAVTEMLQETLAEYYHRGGSLSDVCLDQAGILVGLLLGWKWWTRPDPPPAAMSSSDSVAPGER